MQKQRAIVVHEVFPDEVDEPRIRLEDGQIVTPIWVDRYVVEGTEGLAEWIEDREAWRFTPNESD
jgi:hypothetical protein